MWNQVVMIIEKNHFNSRIPDLRDYAQTNALFVKYRAIGDKACFEQIQIWAYEWVRRFFMELYARGDIREPSETDNLISKSYFAFLDRHTDIRNPSAFTGWLYKVCTCAALDYFRRYPVALTDDDTILDTTVEFDLSVLYEMDSKTVIEDILDEMISYLTEKKILILKYKWIENLPLDVIAEKTGMEVQTVKNNYTAALKVIRNSKSLKKMILTKIHNSY
jgi:RNA polymerase sigma factor (sigma-70 family)